MLRILKASYGNSDVTDILNKLIKGNSLLVKASNDVFGDTAPGVFKYLEVEYEEGTKRIPEGSYLKLPEDNVNKLGIFYTNNNIYKVVNKSLSTLNKFKKDVDILTCVWENLPDNSFYQVQAMTKSGNHLNIIIQILQLLYAAKNSGDYKYVSFLEHDVMYPEGYFDFPDFETGVMTNMNYKGICENGFQKRTADHEPLHQMTMIFTEAIAHFENLIKEAISNGGVLLEPNDNRKQWKCIHPAVHINHGKHFTSHFNIYERGKEKNEDNHWGSFDQYKYLFT